MRKRLVSILVAMSMLSLVGCGSTAPQVELDVGESTPNSEDSEVVQLTVWAEEDDFEMLNKMIESFKQEYDDQAEFEITLVHQTDSGLRNQLLGDVNAGPDVFHFPDDQLNSLIAGGVLSEVPCAEEVTAANTEASVVAASLNGKLYGYPMTADNGYFMYYNKEYFTEDDVKTLDGMIAVAEAAGKKISMEFNSGWYMYSFFGGTGMQLGLNEDGVTNYCDWNTAENSITGKHVAEAMVNVISSPAFMNLGDGEFVENAANGIVIAGISGVWNAIGIKDAWGDNYGAVKLPTYTCNGKQVQMSSFTGFKMVGVNRYSENLDWAHKFAHWITNEENQTLRFVERNQGPSNIKAAASDEVMKVPAIQAVIAQSEFGVLQRTGNNFWTPCTDFANTLLAGGISGDSLQELLDVLVEGITASVAN